MSAKKPRPTETTKQRIEKDKRQLKRLDKKLERLIGMHSPEWLEWVEKIQDDITGESDSVDNWLKSATWSAAWDAEDLLGGFDAALTKFQEKDAGEYDIKQDEAMAKLDEIMYDLVWDAGFEEDRVEKAAYEGTELVRQHLNDIDRSLADKLFNTMWGMEFTIDDVLVEVGLTLGATEISAFEAITRLPALLWSALTVDLDKFVDDAMILYDLQRQLAARIQDEASKRIT